MPFESPDPADGYFRDLTFSGVTGDDFAVGLGTPVRWQGDPCGESLGRGRSLVVDQIDDRLPVCVLRGGGFSRTGPVRGKRVERYEEIDVVVDVVRRLAIRWPISDALPVGLLVGHWSVARIRHGDYLSYMQATPAEASPTDSGDTWFRRVLETRAESTRRGSSARVHDQQDRAPPTSSRLAVAEPGRLVGRCTRR